MATPTPTLDTIFCAAVEIASGEERAAYVRKFMGFTAQHPPLRELA